MHIATKILSSWNFLLWCIRVILWFIRVCLFRKLSQCSLFSHHHSGGVQQKRGLLWSIWIFCTRPKVVVYTSLKWKTMYYLPPALRAFSTCSQREIRTAPGEVTVVTSNVALIQGAGRALWAQSCGNFRKCDIHWAECEVLLLSYTHIFYPYYQRERWWGHVLQQPWASTLGDSIDLQCLHSSSSWWWVSTKPPSLIRRNIGCSWSLAWEVLFFFLFFSVM